MAQPMNTAGTSASTGRILYLMGVPHGHTQYSVGHTSERRALVGWIKLSIMDRETEGTIPTPDLNTFTQWILTGANFPAASHLIKSEGSDVVPHTHHYFSS